MVNEIQGNHINKKNSIDLVKFIMALAVVAIHTDPLINCFNRNILEIYNQIVNLAVPFFFLASGYLLAIRMTSNFSSNEDIQRVKYQLCKIIKMYLIWTVIYFPLAVYHYVSSKISLYGAILLYIRGFLFVGENYNSWPLWYLLSTIYAMIVIIMILKVRGGQKSVYYECCV